MGERCCGGEQSDTHDDQLVNMQKLSIWLREVERGHQAEINILKYILTRDRSFFDERIPGETARADIYLDPIYERVQDKQQLSEQSSTELEQPLSNQNRDLSAAEKFTASRARKPSRAGRHTSIKSSPILQTRQFKPDDVRKSRSYSWSLKRDPREEDVKRDMDLPPRNVEQCVNKAESPFGEAIVCTASSSGNTYDDLEFSTISNNGQRMMRLLTDESSEELTSPGHVHSQQTRLRERSGLTNIHYLD